MTVIACFRLEASSVSQPIHFAMVGLPAFDSYFITGPKCLVSVSYCLLSVVVSLCHSVSPIFKPEKLFSGHTIWSPKCRQMETREGSLGGSV